MSRLHPATSETKSTARKTSLSILDATVVKYDTTSAIWFYQSLKPSSEVVDPLSIDQLRASLVRTLSFHPWLAGQLHWSHSSTSPFSPTTHDKRFRRLAIKYCDAADPGVPFVTASCTSHSLADVVAPPDGRTNVWDPMNTGWTSDQLLPDLNLLALHRFPNLEGSCFAVQITKFRCGGTAIGIAFSHQVADALTLTNFMHDWSSTNAGMVRGGVETSVSPCFEPSLLDVKAVGGIDALAPDGDIISRARSLPILRYDYWVDAEGAPNVDRLPQELKMRPETSLQHGVPIPWSSWDRNAPVSYRVLHFSSDEVEQIYEAATIFSKTSAGAPTNASSITRHDAVLAHIWQCINIARAPLLVSDPDSSVMLTMTMGVRSRLSLPSTFVGSPILTTYIARPANIFMHKSHPLEGDSDKGFGSKSINSIATDINRTQKLFTASAIGDVLHDMAYDICPHRLWQTMLGVRHVLTTSWIHTHVYDEMSFGCEVPSDDGLKKALIPWYVHPSVGKPDGIVLVLEARPDEKVEKTNKWYSRGVDIGVALQTEVMDRLLNGQLLRKFV